MIWRYPTAIFLLFWNVLTHRCFHFCAFTASTACSALSPLFWFSESFFFFRDAQDAQRSESLYFSLLQIRTVDLKISLIFNVLFYFLLHIFQFFGTEILRSRLRCLLSKDNFSKATYPYLSAHSVLFSSRIFYYISCRI